MEPKTSVVITTRDRLPLLQRVVGAVRQDPATAEIVVVDDASADGTADWLRALDGDGAPMMVLRSPGVGPGAARQAGVEGASGDLVVLLDDDVVPRPGLVSGHRERLRGEPDRVVVGYMPVGLPPRRGPGDVAVFAYDRDYERRCDRYERARVPVLVNVWGGNLSLWRDAALRVGMVSPAFDAPHTFYEDRDFGLRAHRSGMHAVFDRGLAAVHLHRRSARTALTDAVRRGESAVRLHAFHGDLIGPYDPAALLSGLPRAAAAALEAARRRRAEKAFLPAVEAAMGVAGRLGRWGAQDDGFRFARRLCEQRGALAAGVAGPA